MVFNWAWGSVENLAWGQGQRRLRDRQKEYTVSYNRDFLALLSSAEVLLKHDRLPVEALHERPATYTESFGDETKVRVPVTLWVKPSTGKARKHRVMLRCGVCGDECTAGKFHFHLKGSFHKSFLDKPG